MTATRTCWLVTADERVGRLLRIDRTERGYLRIGFADHIQEAWEEHEHGRPSPRSGKSGTTYASLGHETETRRARFAKAVGVWLEESADRMGIDRLEVFAPPRFLGELRQAWSPRLAPSVAEHEGELTHLAEGTLLRHSSVIELMRDDGDGDG